MVLKVAVANSLPLSSWVCRLWISTYAAEREKPPQLIGPEARAGTAAGAQIALVVFNSQLGGPSLAIAFPVQVGGAIAPHVGHNVAHVGAPLGPTSTFTITRWGAFSAGGRVAEAMVAPGGLPGLAVELLGATDRYLRPGVQDRVARQPGQKMNPIGSPGPFHKVGRAKVGIAPNHDHRIGPFPAKPLDDPPQKGKHIGRLTAPAGFKDRSNQLTGQSLINVNRHIAILPVEAVKQGELLLAVGGIVGIIAIQNHQAGLTGIGADKSLHKTLREAIQIGAADPVLKAAYGGLGGQIARRVRVRPLHIFNTGSARRWLQSSPSSYPQAIW